MERDELLENALNEAERTAAHALRQAHVPERLRASQSRLWLAIARVLRATLARFVGELDPTDGTAVYHAVPTCERPFSPGGNQSFCHCFNEFFELAAAVLNVEVDE